MNDSCQVIKKKLPGNIGQIGVKTVKFVKKTCQGQL